MKTSETTLNERIGEWRAYLARRNGVQGADVDELEDHLRSQVESLADAGLDHDEAFLVAVKRLGDLDTISREFAHEYSERLWKQLVLPKDEDRWDSLLPRDAVLAVLLAVCAAIAIMAPRLFGLRLLDNQQLFYATNLPLFVLPFVAVYFGWKRRIGTANSWLLAAPFLVAALAMNLYPFEAAGDTHLLSMLHLPIALWLVVGFAYAAGQWRSHEQRMNYVRFTGEWFIYYTLIALGGGVLMVFTLFVFKAIGMQAIGLVLQWMLPCGAVGAVVVAAWLVESKQNVIENMAPVLTLIFTPLFTALLLVFVAVMMVTGSAIQVEREVLIGFDLLLVLVLGLLLYAISARPSTAPADLFDGLRFLLVASALLVDVLALWAIAARISEFGFTPNRTAALGLNLLLLANLGWSAVLYGRFLLHRTPFASLERWQTAYAPVYVLWLWVVVLVFPVLFGFE